MKTKQIIPIIIIVVLAGVTGFILYEYVTDNLEESPQEQSLVQSDDYAASERVLITNLEIPWEIAFLPNGNLLVSQRPGRLTLIENEKPKNIQIPNVEHTGEGGLLGLAVHPNYSENKFIYLYLTYRESENIANKVVRYTFENNSLENPKVIIDKIPGASYHDGGRIKFGPKGFLFVTVGDTGNEDLAQDRDSLAGKILRLNDNGSIPEDNPFDTAIWTWGHRNPQGITWDNDGKMWSTEHGRSGAKSGYDELNLIEKGKNYGWPVIQGPQEREKMETPIIQSGPSTTWAPAGAAFFEGSIYFAGLAGSTLYEYNIRQNSLVKHLSGKYGRLRAVTVHNELLYVSTSNRDGRGSPVSSDDRVIVINPDTLD